jgi:hypothetical protein
MGDWLLSACNDELLAPLDGRQQPSRIFLEFFYRGSAHVQKSSVLSALNQPNN